ncbi:hypothetical protein BKA66DRAFT_574410 [Pyrenochaeta sp. MPI-SDFR-AT-0127]|nr:hypothetical protein BKA66DRAFT_574410 [Pyrenochaeta sp. MPI-SDFR-AT-0127]
MDYLVSAGFVCELIVLAVFIPTIHLGISGYDYYISLDARIKISKLLFVVGIVGFWASSLTRISIGSMLLRFPVSYAWRVTLWILVVVQIALPIGANIFQLLQCRPIRAMWEPVPGSVCWTNRTSQSFGYIYAVIGTMSDLVFAIMPVYLFCSMNRPIMERMLAVALMGFGTVAALAGIMKIYHISAFNPRHAMFRDWLPLIWWYRVEEIGLIVAACAPFLKPLIERMLSRLGAWHLQFQSLKLNTIRLDQGSGRRHSGETDSSKKKTTAEQQSA